MTIIHVFVIYDFKQYVIKYETWVVGSLIANA